MDTTLATPHTNGSPPPIDYTPEPNNPIKYGQLVQAAREERGIPPEDVADRLGIIRSSYKKYETGRASPADEKHEILCEVLGLDPVAMNELRGPQRTFAHSLKVGYPSTANRGTATATDEREDDDLWDYDFGDEPNSGFGQLIRRARVARGLTVDQLARKCGIAASTLGSTESISSTLKQGLGPICHRLGLNLKKMEALREYQVEFIRIRRERNRQIVEPSLRAIDKIRRRYPLATRTADISLVDAEAHIGEAEPDPAGSRAIALLAEYISLDDAEKAIFQNLVDAMEKAAK